MKKVKEEPEPERNVEYVSEQLDVMGPAVEAFSDVFARFQLPPDASTVSSNSHLMLKLNLTEIHVGTQVRELQRRGNLFRR